ncbi:hypothetical protein [Streptomyces cinnamoneus]|nr:hypothetical protein [Streptomyces cinnamoneus]
MGRRFLVAAVAVALAVGSLAAPQPKTRNIPYAVHRQSGDTQ